MRYAWIVLTLLFAAPLPAESLVIWKCIDLQRLKEFSSIRCAPDAEIYVPARTNAGGVAPPGKSDRAYIEFLNRHTLHSDRSEAPASAADESPPSREGRNLDRFKTYSIQR